MVHSVPDGTVHVTAQDLDRDGDLDVVLTIQSNFTGGSRADQLMFMWVYPLCVVCSTAFNAMFFLYPCLNTLVDPIECYTNSLLYHKQQQ